MRIMLCFYGKNHSPWIAYLKAVYGYFFPLACQTEVNVNALHWFNPIVYLAYRDIVRYCELSCDESVIARMDNQERRRYCELILSILWNIASQNTKTISAFNDDRKHLERRIGMIMKNGNLKNKKVMIAVSILLIRTVSWSCLHCQSIWRFYRPPNTLHLHL